LSIIPVRAVPDLTMQRSGLSTKILLSVGKFGNIALYVLYLQPGKAAGVEATGSPLQSRVLLTGRHFQTPWLAP